MLRRRLSHQEPGRWISAVEQIWLWGLRCWAWRWAPLHKPVATGVTRLVVGALDVRVANHQLLASKLPASDISK
eukprot:scaffold4409_cov369-Prasinococcus_capsulatus_cf.AAC.40